jgi:general secretion pathway protein J
VTRRDAGFTLLELLVALVVLGLLMAGLTQGIRFGFSAWGMQARLGASSGDLDAIDRALRRLVEQARPPADQVTPSLRGTGSSLAFISALPVTLAAATREADIRLSVDGGRLVLDWMPHLHAAWLGPPRQPRREVLLDHVEALEVSYLGSAGWVKSWDTARLPLLIRLHLRFPKGDPRHWPDLVAGPIRDGV